MERLFKNILIGFTFSPNLKANIFEAMRMTYFAGEKLYLLHVGRKTSSHEKQIKTIIDSYNEPQPQSIEIIWEESDHPVKSILENCKLKKINLLLLGALQRENIYKYYMGSIARELTLKAECSVLLYIKPSVVRKPANHAVVNAFNSEKTAQTIFSSLQFANAIGVSKVTLVEEIDKEELKQTVEDSISLRKVNIKKEKLKKRELSRVTSILETIPENLKELTITNQSIFGKKGYSIGHYARVVRADLLVMHFEKLKNSFWYRFFPRDIDYILSELPTDVLIIKN